MAEAPYRWKALERVSCRNGTVQGSYFSASALRGREARFDLLGQRSHVRLHEDIFVRAGDNFDVHTLSGEIAPAVGRIERTEPRLRASAQEGDTTWAFLRDIISPGAQVQPPHR